MTAPVILVDASPRRANDGVVQAVRLAGGGALYPYRYGAADYRAGIIQLPDFITALPFEGDFGAGGVPQAAELEWSPSSKADLAAIANYFWIDAALTVRIGEENAAGTLPPVVLTGKVLAATVDGGVLKIALCDPAVDLKKPLLTARYGGTGNLDGPAEWDGKIKRRLWGRVWNIAGELIDAANSIYCWADPAQALQGFDAVRDKGAPAASLTTVAWQGSQAATLAALRAATAPQGGGVTCPSIACVKWWTQPAGELTADVRGEIGAGYVERTAQIVERIVQAGPNTAFAAGTVAAASALRTAPVGWVAKDENTTVAAMIEELLGHSSLLWLLDSTGAIVIREWAWGASAASAISQSVKRTDVLRPVGTRKIGYARNETPTARGNLAAIVLASDAAYLDGTPLESLKPAQVASDKTSTNTAAAITGQGPLATSPLTAGEVTNAYVADANVCPNGGLQNSAAGWTLGSGANAIKGTTTADPDYYVRNTTDLAESISPQVNSTERSFKAAVGEKLFIKFLARSQVVGSATCRARVRFVWYDATGASLSGDELLAAPTAANTWQTFFGFTMVPATAVKGQVRFRPNTGGGWVDVGPIFLARAESGADITGNNTAAAFTGQGALATKSSVNLSTADAGVFGSIPLSVPSGGFTYTSTTTTVTISWAAFTIYRADLSTIAVSAGSQAITGLSAATTYRVYPYIVDSGGSSATVAFVAGASAGAPAIAHPAAGSALAAATMNQRGNVPLGRFSVVTPGSGSGGGSGGGSNCLHPDMKLGGARAATLEAGDLVPSPNGLIPIRSVMRTRCSEWFVLFSGPVEIARVTGDHLLYLATGEAVRARNVQIGSLLRTDEDHCEVTGIHLDREMRLLVGIDVGEPHLHFGGPMNLLMHNGTDKP